jgi:copper chaperone
MTTTTYGVVGLTCQHCVNAVTTELCAVSGVSDVSVALTVDGISTVCLTSVRPLTREQVCAALDEAGRYRLAFPS